jgi:hypothetical protein
VRGQVADEVRGCELGHFAPAVAVEHREHVLVLTAPEAALRSQRASTESE